MANRALFRRCTLKSAPETSGSSRLLPAICWVVSGLALAGSLAWIAFGKDKGLGILLGIVAIVVNRVLLGFVASSSAPGRGDAGRSGGEPRD